MKNVFNYSMFAVGAFSSFVLCDSLMREHVNLSSLALCFISILSLVVVHFIIKMRNAREREEEEWRRRFLDCLARLRREEEQRQRARAILPKETKKQEIKRKNPLMKKAKKKKESCMEELIF